VETEKIAIDRDVVLRTPGDRPLEGHAGELSLLEDDGRVELRLRLTVSWEAYRAARDSALFHWHPELDPGAAGEPGPAGGHPGGQRDGERGGQRGGLTAGKAVELELQLHADAQAALVSKGDASAVAKALATDGPATVLGTESWILRRVMQEVDLPKELEGAGQLKTGFETAWARRRGKEPIASKLRSAGQAAGLALEVVDERLLRARVKGEHGAWTLLVHATDDPGIDGVCTFYGVFPQAVPVERRAEVAQFLVDRNYDLSAAAFEMDLDDGEIRLRTGLTAGASGLTTATIEDLLRESLQVMEAHFTTLEHLIEGALDLDDARAIFAPDDDDDGDDGER
jgi:hypothetical protein